MNFQVPQFIEVEDTIFGPLTFKQFVYILGGGGIDFLLYNFLPLYIAIIPIILVSGLALALAFYKVNDRPFIKTLEAAFWYLFSKKLYIWEKSEPVVKKQKEVIDNESENPINIPKLSRSKLKDLSWSLDIKEKIR